MLIKCFTQCNKPMSHLSTYTSHVGLYKYIDTWYWDKPQMTVMQFSTYIRIYIR